LPEIIAGGKDVSILQKLNGIGWIFILFKYLIVN